MKNLAPHILRQRLLIEGFYKGSVDKKVIDGYFNEITTALKLRMYGKPIIFSTGKAGKEENQGYDAFVPLIDSGISLYVWSNAKFLSILLYTCKSFDENKAVEVTIAFFGMENAEFQSF